MFSGRPRRGLLSRGIFERKILRIHSLNSRDRVLLRTLNWIASHLELLPTQCMYTHRWVVKELKLCGN